MGVRPRREARIEKPTTCQEFLDRLSASLPRVTVVARILSWPEGGRSLCIWCTSKLSDVSVSVQLKPENYANGTEGLAEVAVQIAESVKAEMRL